MDIPGGPDFRGARVEWDLAEAVDGPLGQAYRQSATIDSDSCQLVLMIDAPQRWPDCLLFQARLANRGDGPISARCLSALQLELDPGWAHALWTMQGAAVNWGQDFAFPLPERFSRNNYLGHHDYGEGGGVPLNYCWNPQLGLGLAHIEKEQVLWHMPLHATPENGVLMSFERLEPLEILPGQEFITPQLLISLHQGDFYDPLALYREIMAAQGIIAPEPTPESYQPAWCSWGYEFDVRAAEVLAPLPILEELGIHWLTLDDRWFDYYGDWNPRPQTFPNGEAEMRQMVAGIHQAGSHAQLWWYPLCAEDGTGAYEQPYAVAQVLREHPDWVILHADGSAARNNRGLAVLCPGLPEVQDYTLALTRRFIDDWGFDGIKLDNIYTVPACYNPAHHHQNPEEALEGFAQVYRKIFELTRLSKPYAVTQICPCGTPLTHTLIPATDQVVTADPTSSAQIRQRIKFYKGLMGPQFPVFADHVELSDEGVDFASEIGAGGIPATKFVWPLDEQVRSRLKEEYWPLTPEKMEAWKSWFALARQYSLQSGEYLNLYDLGFDRPEAHAIQKGERIYYAFYTLSIDTEFSGPVQLRGLERKPYRVRDIVQERDLGLVDGPRAEIQVSFRGSLLLEAAPIL